MMVGLLVAAMGLVLAGLLAIGYGFTIKEFSTGNTLILSGVMGACAGAIMFALWMAIRELKNIARRLGGGLPEARREVSVRPVLPPGASALAPPGPTFDDQPAAADAPPPWQDDDHPQGDPPGAGPADTAPLAARPKRNLMFSSTSRKERERAQARTSEPLPPDLLSPDIRPNPSAPPPPAESAEPPASFDDAWPKPDRARPGDVPSQRRSGRTPSTFEANGAPAGDDSQSAVTVLKSGVVDGMAYSLYSDGSIEAQMPEGMMRFASIDELRAHLDQRP
jgi:hypothetical protein